MREGDAGMLPGEFLCFMKSWSSGELQTTVLGIADAVAFLENMFQLL